MVTTTDFWPGHPLSYTTTIIRIFYNEIEISNATGFIIKFGQHYALVTNWHVLSGINPVTDKALSKTGALPNRITFHVALSTRTKHEGTDGEELHFRPCELLLYEDGVPIWVDSKAPENQHDFCAIKLEKYIPELRNKAASLRAIHTGRITLRKGIAPKDGRVRPEDINSFYPMVGSDVFILGYPSGVTYSEIFPIWKKASIASEPLMGVRQSAHTYDELLYVDGLTKHGMSGSPVVYLPNLGERFQTDDGVWVTAEDETPLLLGVYAGRDGVTREEYELALGRVWKTFAIERLFYPDISRVRPL